MAKAESFITGTQPMNRGSDLNYLGLYNQVLRPNWVKESTNLEYATSGDLNIFYTWDGTIAEILGR